MANYKTPGVYVEEISKLPASVAQVETAIPAFIGYTEKAEKDGLTLINDPTRISSMIEYEELYGGPPIETGITVSVNDSKDQDDNIVKRIIVVKEPETPSKFLMYYSLSMFFSNGGGPCYIISVGNYNAEDHSDLVNGLAELEKEDEPTLIVFPDAIGLSESDYYSLYQSAFSQCNKLQDRFVLIDIYNENIENFRNIMTSDYLKYGAAYSPYLKTTLKYRFTNNGVVVSFPGIGSKYNLSETDINNLSFTLGDNQLVAINEIKNKDFDDKSAFESALEIAISDAGTSMSETRRDEVVDAAAPSSNTLADMKETNTELYNLIKTEIKKLSITLPPSSVMAGVYARVDKDRGVWKAPANVSLNSVIKPTKKITSEDQENLNIDPVAGKSINAIRTFAGKGTLVWGARTLAGNDNEWRYISVRRFFNMVEESVKKSSSWVVFEPNDANTWVKVRAMIENYLTILWRQGALAGAKAEDAFFVRVGLGQTMTPQDILEGRLIIEIGMAAVRPAEFIILKFSHKIQE